MTYDQAIEYLKEVTKYDTEDKLIRFVKEIYYDYDIPITEKSVKHGIMTYAEYLETNTIYIN